LLLGILLLSFVTSIHQSLGPACPNLVLIYFFNLFFNLFYHQDALIPELILAVSFALLVEIPYEIYGENECSNTYLMGIKNGREN